ncbi:MAG: GTP-binding protein [Paracoccaceae bacterium]
MSNLEKIPVTILTGFLGAGKTTLIRNLIIKNKSKRLAVIINEFGDLGVDGEIVKTMFQMKLVQKKNILELANGCICCTVADDFVPYDADTAGWKNTFQSIYLLKHLGLRFQNLFLKRFEWPEIRSKLTVDSVLAVVDAEAVVNGVFAPQMSSEIEK